MGVKVTPCMFYMQIFAQFPTLVCERSKGDWALGGGRGVLRQAKIFRHQSCAESACISIRAWDTVNFCPLITLFDKN